MKRRINFTGRKAIPLEKIAIRLVDVGQPSSIKRFDADLARIADLNLDASAKIYVEAYVNSSSMRFSFGTVGAPRAPEDTELPELDNGGSILFRVRVVDETADIGHILASADAIRPKDETDSDDNEKAILPVRLRDLGEAVWIIELQGVARPELVINNRIPGLVDRLKSDPLIQGAIIPHAVTRVLEAALKENAADDSLEWVQDWRRFASVLLGNEVGDDLEEDEIDQLITQVVERFVMRLRSATRAAAVVPTTGVVYE